MEINRVQPSFGMAMKYKNPQKVEYYMFRHLNNNKKYTEYEFLRNKNNFCDVDMQLSVIKDFLGKEHLKVEVGSKNFITNLLTSPIRVLRKATAYAFKLSEQNELQAQNINKIRK